MKPAPSAHFNHNFQPLCTLDVENEEEVRASKKIERVPTVTNSVDACTVTTLDVIAAFAVQQG
jgi:hypothetical protein